MLCCAVSGGDGRIPGGFSFTPGRQVGIEISDRSVMRSSPPHAVLCYGHSGSNTCLPLVNKRHRDILQDYSMEFRRMTSTLGELRTCHVTVLRLQPLPAHPCPDLSSLLFHILISLHDNYVRHAGAARDRLELLSGPSGSIRPFLDPP